MQEIIHDPGHRQQDLAHSQIPPEIIHDPGLGQQESVTEAADRLRSELGHEACIVCILGGTEFRGPDSEALVQAIGFELGAATHYQANFVTGGMAGVQATFAQFCGDGSRLWNLLPVGQASGYGRGCDINAGADVEERKAIFGLLGDIYITVEGGSGVSQEAAAAFERGALVVPLMRTGGASVGMFNFPAGALQRPDFVPEWQWSLLASKEAPVEDSAAAVAAIVAACVGAPAVQEFEQPLPIAEEVPGSYQVVAEVQEQRPQGLAEKIVFGDLDRSCLVLPMLLSGACDGADVTFGEMALAHQHRFVHFLGPGDLEWTAEKAREKQSHGFEHVAQELLEGAVVSEAFDKAAMSRVLGSQRTPGWEARVAEMAARRNFLQVRCADAVYVVGWRLQRGKDQFTGRNDCAPRETPLLDVGGGTGWACQWYVDRFADGMEDPDGCQLFFFDDAGPPWAMKDPATEGKWNRWNIRSKAWEPLGTNPPKPFGLYAGIGATRLSNRAESAIRSLYQDEVPQQPVSKIKARLAGAGFNFT